MKDVASSRPRVPVIGVSIFITLIALGFVVWLKHASANLSQAQLPVLGQVADFTLTNEDGQVTTLAALTNHVWVADIIFTRCAGPCPRITGQMHGLQEALPKGDSMARLVTLTTDPDYDSPAIMKRYGERFGADFHRWMFLTGTKREIAGLAGGSLKLSAAPVNASDRKTDVDLFIHSTLFVLIDKHAQMRGIFETGGDNVDWPNVVQPRLLQDVQQLENEP